MLKLNNIVSHDARLRALSEQLHQKSQLQQFWQFSAPAQIANHSHAVALESNTLHIVTTHPLVATKIKMLQASLLKALDNYRNNNHHFNQYKVTAIKVKVQVKSTPQPRPSRINPISASSAQHLSAFAETLTGTRLGEVLKKLSSHKT